MMMALKHIKSHSEHKKAPSKPRHGHERSSGNGSGPSNGNGSDDTNPLAIAGSAFSAIVSTAMATAGSVPKVQVFLSSLVGIFVICLIVMIIVALFFFARPVIPSPCHSSEFDTYMTDEYYPDFVLNLKLFAKNCSRFTPLILRGENPAVQPTSKFSPQLNSGNVSNLANAAAVNLLSFPGGDAELQKNLRTYYAHFRCFASRDMLPYSFFCGTSLATNPDFVDTTRGGGNVDPAKVASFESTVVTYVETIRNATKAISDVADAYRDIESAAWYDADAFAWLTAVHKLRMYLNEYHENINASALSRMPDKYATNTWILYYIPVIHDVLRYRIPEVWAAVPGTFITFLNLWKMAWTKLGNILVNIPCYMVFTGAKRAQYCSIKMF